MIYLLIVQVVISCVTFVFLRALVALVREILQVEKSTIVPTPMPAPPVEYKQTPPPPPLPTVPSIMTPFVATVERDLVKLFNLDGYFVGLRPVGHPDIEEARKLGWRVEEQ